MSDYRDILLSFFDNSVVSIVDGLPEIIVVYNKTKKCEDFFSYFEGDNARYDPDLLSKFFQYSAIRLQLSIMMDYLESFSTYSIGIEKLLVTNSKKEFIEILNNVHISPVLTAHPTEVYSNEALLLLQQLYLWGESYFVLWQKTTDFQKLKHILLKLFDIKFIPDKAMSVDEEIVRNLSYIDILYKSYCRLKKLITECYIKRFPDCNAKDIKNLKNTLINIFSLRSWVGGDADGNNNVTADTMRAALKAQSNYILERYKDLLGDIEVTSFSEVQRKAALVADNNEELSALLQTFSYYVAKIDVRQNAPIVRKVVTEIISSEQYISNNEGCRKKIIIDLIDNQEFINIALQSYKNKQYSSLIMRELDRIELMQQAPEVFSNYIISNTESDVYILELLLLFKIFNCKANIIPLFESLASLNNCTNIIADLFNNDHYKDYIKHITNSNQVIMLGFSDLQRESGTAAVVLIDDIKNELDIIAQQHHIEITYFYGNGLDLGRGGVNIINAMQTIQGNQQRYMFFSAQSTTDYLIKSLGVQILSLNKACIFNDQDLFIKDLAINSGKRYQDFLKHNNINDFFYYNSGYKLFVKTHNFSSRAGKRTGQDSNDNIILGKISYEADITDNLRAIPQLNIIESTATFFNLWLGLKYLLDDLGDMIDLNNICIKYQFITDMVNKAIIGLELADFSIAKQFCSEPHASMLLRQLKDDYQECAIQLAQKYFDYNSIASTQLHIRKDIACNAHYYMSYITRKMIKQQQCLSSIYKTDNIEEFVNRLFGYVYCIFVDYRMPGFEYYYSSFYKMVSKTIKL